MTLLALGVNHKTAPLIVREKLALNANGSVESLLELVGQEHVDEVAILSTCNRTELYCGTQGNAEAVKHWLFQRSNVALDDYIYVHREQQAVRHIMRVASGLDSMVLGEPQILGQMKNAYSVAHRAGTLGTRLNRLFQYVFAVTKQVRTDTNIGASSVSVAYSAVNLSKRIFADLAKSTVLLIGAGETIELVARYLYDNKVRNFIFANRTLEKAQYLVNKFSGKAILIGEVPDYLTGVDMVISSTASQLPLLGKGAVERALKQRSKHSPMFMVDLAVPRDIEPEVGELDDVYLYTIDDLQEVVEENLQQRHIAAEQAENIIELKSDYFMRWQLSLKAMQTLCHYRQQVEALRDEEVEKARALLAKGGSPEEVVTALARALTQKIMHEPTIRMRQAAMDDKTELLAQAKYLLGIRSL